MQETQKMLELIEAELKGMNYKFFQPTSYNDCLTSDNSLLIQDYLQDPNSAEDFCWDWDTTYDEKYVEERLKESLSEKGYSEEQIEEFFEEEEDNIKDYIFSYCSQPWKEVFAEYFSRSKDFSYTYYIGDMEEETSLEDLICPKYNINSLDDIEEKIFEQDTRALRYGLLLGYSIEELYKSYFSEDWSKNDIYPKLATIAVNDFRFTTLYFAFRMSSKDIINLRRTLKNWDVVSFNKWEWWIINTSEGGGWMHEDLDFSELKFVFNWGKVTIDEETWVYPYYAEVKGCPAEYWSISIVEKSKWEEAPNTVNNLLLETAKYRQQKEQYRQTGCGGADCSVFSLHQTTYRNDYPAWWTCKICGRFFID